MQNQNLNGKYDIEPRKIIFEKYLAQSDNLRVF